MYDPFAIDTVGEFADNFNHKEEKYNSKYYCPGSSHVNAFTRKQINEENWLYPPVSCIGSIIMHLKLYKAK